MLIKIKRFDNGDPYIIGRLTIDGKFLCHTLEPSSSRKAHPAIPKGRYKVTKYPSAKFRGFRPILNNVPGRSGILIHEGNTVKDTQGCILVGMNTLKAHVLQSKVTLSLLMNRLEGAWSKGEEVFLEYA